MTASAPAPRGDGSSPTASARSLSSDPSRRASNVSLPSMFAASSRGSLGGRDLSGDSRSPETPGSSPDLDRLTGESSPDDEHMNSQAYHANRHTLKRASSEIGISLEAMNPPSMPCICTRSPKIPRPRNAFILFRQAHQARVVSENPGLANPDISKIIGDMWQNQAQHVKNYWKELAEKEKIQHRERYPDYRYQPRRAGRGRQGGARPGMAGASGSAGGMGGEAADDGSRCPRCGGRSIVPPQTPATPRLAPGSANQQQQHPPSSSVSAGIRGSSFRYDDGRPHPGYPDHDENGRPYDSGHAQYYYALGSRRPLPQHGRPGNIQVGSESKEEDIDMKRRRYDGAHFGGGQSSGSGSHIVLPYRPSGSQNYADSPSTPASGALPPPGTPAHPAASGPWSGAHPPPPPPRHASDGRFPNGYSSASGSPANQSHNAPPLSHPVSKPSRNYPCERPPIKNEYGGLELPPTPRGYPGLPAKLPPPSSSYGYYQAPASTAGSGMQTPSTALAGLTMASTPTSATPSATAGPRQQQQPGFNDASLKLPPLQTHMATGSQSPARSESSSGGPAAAAAAAAGQDRNEAGGSVGGGIVRMQDVRSFAFSSTPITDGSVDKTSQESGIQAMIMTIPHLNKIEVLRRISPQLPLKTKRGPIIAIEGQNPALTEAVGRIVQKALAQSGECALRVWEASTKRPGGDDGESGDTPDKTATKESLLSYHQFMAPWHAKAQDMVRHVKSETTTTTATIKTEPAETAGSDMTITDKPSTAISIVDMTNSSDAADTTTAATTTTTTTTTTTPTSPGSSASPMLTPTSTSSRSPKTSSFSPVPMQTDPPLSALPLSFSSPSSSSAAPLLPVALVTGGYSVAIADHFATHVPIEDEYAPIDHWHWMATMWRGVAQPDLVVYADGRPRDKSMDTPINRTAMDGVMVVHAGSEAQTIDEVTERRLSFEVMEWVRASPFRSMWEAGGR